PDDELPPAPIEIGDGSTHVRIELNPFRLTLADGARIALTTIAGEGAAEATHDEPGDIKQAIPGWDGYEAVEDAWARPREASLVEKTASSARLRLTADGGTIELSITITGAKVVLRETSTGRSKNDAARPWNKMAMSFALGADTHLFGLGERYASIDHRGLSLYSWSEEAGLGAGESAPLGPANPFPSGPSMTYFPVPFFLSSDGVGVHVRTNLRVETHFGSERPDALRVAINGTEMDLVVYLHEDPLATIDDFTRDTGRPMLPAPWVFGPRRRVSPEYLVDGVEEWKVLRQRKVPTTGLDDSVHFLPARSELGREAELEAWTKALHANGYKVQGYYNPYVASNRPSAKTDYDYGVSHGLFLLKPDGTPGLTNFVSGTLLDVAAIDLTNPEGVAWFQSILGRSRALGYDGWMHDFGEYTRRDWTAHDGRNGAQLHNEFPVLSAKAAHDFWEKERPNDYLFFVRSGWTGTQAYAPVVWGGDPEATFDETQGLPAMLRGGVNLAMSGVPFWGSDISGFKCFDNSAPRDKEMYLRWAQFGAVSPVMMEQNACTAIVEKKTKWTLYSDDETTKVYGDLARLHTRLQPYFLVLAKQANLTGRPLMMHPFLLHPKEKAAWSVPDAFYLGPALYASPVVRRGVFEKKTWLPPGKRFVDLDDLRVYQGGAEVTIPAPLAKLPLLRVSGEILPLLDASIETLAPATDPEVVTLEKVSDRLDLQVALAAGQEAKLVLVDGTELTATRAADAGNPASIAIAPTEADLAACDGCYLDTKQGDVDRLRVTTTLAATTDVTLQDVHLVARGPSARRIRWDVLRLR
ncbi:MAG: TIM-barrel domain-containing protein, partial [Polyangiales bacterium]